MFSQTPPSLALAEIAPFLRDRYEIGEYLGAIRGRCMYRACDRRRNASVQLHVPTGVRGVQGLLREIRATTLLHIPVLSRPREVGDPTVTHSGKGVSYLVYDELSGYSLAHVLSRIGVLSLPNTVDLVLPLLEALEGLHAIGMSHGGIDPSTVWLREVEDGRLSPALRLFGELEPHERRYMTGSLAPELLEGRESDARSDLFAIGALVLRCITGEAPGAPVIADGDAPGAAGRGFRNTAEWNALSLDPHLTRLLRRATDPEPLARFDDAASLRESLANYRSRPGAPPGTLPPLIRTVG